MITNRAKLRQASQQRPNAVTPPDRCAICQRSPAACQCPKPLSAMPRCPICHELPTICRCSPAAAQPPAEPAAGRLRLDQHEKDCDYPRGSCWCKTKDQVSV